MWDGIGTVRVVIWSGKARAYLNSRRLWPPHVVSIVIKGWMDQGGGMNREMSWRSWVLQVWSMLVLE